MHLVASFPSVRVEHDLWQSTHALADVPSYAPEQAHVPELVPPIKVARVLQAVQLLVAFEISHLRQVELHATHDAASVLGMKASLHAQAPGAEATVALAWHERLLAAPEPLHVLKVEVQSVQGLVSRESKQIEDLSAGQGEKLSQPAVT